LGLHPLDRHESHRPTLVRQIADSRD